MSIFKNLKGWRTLIFAAVTGIAGFFGGPQFLEFVNQNLGPELADLTVRLLLFAFGLTTAWLRTITDTPVRQGSATEIKR